MTKPKYKIEGPLSLLSGVVSALMKANYNSIFNPAYNQENIDHTIFTDSTVTDDKGKPLELGGLDFDLVEKYKPQLVQLGRSKVYEFFNLPIPEHHVFDELD